MEILGFLWSSFVVFGFLGSPLGALLVILPGLGGITDFQTFFVCPREEPINSSKQLPWRAHGEAAGPM